MKPSSEVGSTMQTLQSEANRAPGPRSVPARRIPIPAELDPTSVALVSAPYSPAWNLEFRTISDWQEFQLTWAKGVEAKVAGTRERLDVSIHQLIFGGVPAYLLEPHNLSEPRRSQLVLSFHGGGYALGLGVSGTAEATLTAAYGGFRVLSVDYRLSPDAPYPAALDDAASVWRALIEIHDPRSILVSGVSAGGGLALALMLRLKATGMPLPAAMSLASPWSDMTPTGDSYATNEWLDNVLVSYDGYLGRAARLYAADHDLRDPGLSPIYGDFNGMPPSIISTGTRDLFLSNAVRTHRRLRQAGVDAELHVYEGLAHAQFALDPDVTVTREAYHEITCFFDRHVSSPKTMQEFWSK